MQRDMQNDGEKPPDENTIRSYHNALEKISVVEDMPAWTPPPSRWCWWPWGNMPTGAPPTAWWSVSSDASSLETRQ